MQPILRATEHRPYPLPRGPWIMTQTWHDLLFAHWALPPASIRPLVPAQLELDLFDGRAWIAVTPFRMSRVHPRAVPSIPGLSAFPELNVRTYVRVAGQGGVFFFSLDCTKGPAVWAARTFYRLPYFRAQMSVEHETEAVRYLSRRLEYRPAEFRGAYWPASEVRPSLPGTLEHFLTERYCLYTVHRAQVYRAGIHHLPWPLQQAQAEIAVNTMAAAAGVELPPQPPLLHFSRELKVFVWPLERVSS